MLPASAEDLHLHEPDVVAERFGPRPVLLQGEQPVAPASPSQPAKEEVDPDTTYCEVEEVQRLTVDRHVADADLEHRDPVVAVQPGFTDGPFRSGRLRHAWLQDQRTQRQRLVKPTEEIIYPAEEERRRNRITAATSPPASTPMRIPIQVARTSRLRV